MTIPVIRRKILFAKADGIGKGQVNVTYEQKHDAYLTELILTKDSKPYYTCLKNDRMYVECNGLIYLKDNKYLEFYAYLIPYRKVAENFDVIFSYKSELYSISAHALFDKKYAVFTSEDTVAKKLYYPLEELEDYRLRADVMEMGSQMMSKMVF